MRAAALSLLLALSVSFAGCPPPSGEGEGEGEGEPITVTLAPVADTTLFESSTGNLANGAGQYLFTGRTDQGKRRRALLRFDIAAAIPAGATITDVRLRLHMSRTIAGEVTQRVYRAPEDWGEGASDAPDMEGTGTTPQPGDATWLQRFFPNDPWATAGGGNFAVEDAHATTSVNAIGSYEFASTAMTQDTQAWLDDASSDFGWIILGDETAITNAKRWDSRESPTPANRPALTITYAP